MNTAEASLQRHRLLLLGEVLFFITISLGAGLWQAWRDPTGADRILLVGAVAALVGLSSYDVAVQRLEGRSWMRGLMAFAGFLPLALAVYLPFYKGLWGFSKLLAGFSWGVLARSTVWTLVGYQLAHSLMELTELTPTMRSQDAATAPVAEPSGTALPNSDQDLIASFGEFLQSSSARHTALAKLAGELDPMEAIKSGLMWELHPLRVRPESELPYPVATILAAIERVLPRTNDPTLYEQLRVCLLMLRNYAPDSEVPADRSENLREGERRSEEPLPPSFDERRR